MFILFGLGTIAISILLISIKYKRAYAELIVSKEQNPINKKERSEFYRRLKFN